MNKKVTITLGVIIALVFITPYVFILAQEPQDVTVRYKLDVGDIWEYECVTESEANRTAPTQGTSLRYIKENFKYEVLEITPEGYFKVKLNTSPVESRGVNIKGDKRNEMHDFVAADEYEEIILNLKGEIITLTFTAIRITDTLIFVYEDMISYLRPVMPEEAVGINDTWNYQVAIVPEEIPGMSEWAQKYPALISYKVIAFEEKDGFDCIKIEYSYNTDLLSAEINERAAQDEEMQDKEWELKVNGTGTLYFAYNEGFVVSRKENLINTDIKTKLVNDKWEISEKCIERIGFTMNYIKP